MRATLAGERAEKRTSGLTGCGEKRTSGLWAELGYAREREEAEKAGSGLRRRRGSELGCGGRKKGEGEKVFREGKWTFWKEGNLRKKEKGLRKKEKGKMVGPTNNYTQAIKLCNSMNATKMFLHLIFIFNFQKKCI